MRTIGMLGGMSWESTAEYCRLANELVRERLGGYHSAPIPLDSVDFAEIEARRRGDPRVERMPRTGTGTLELRRRTR